MIKNLRFIFFLKPHKKSFIIAILSLLATDLLALSMPFSLKLLVDNILVNKNISLLNIIFIGMLFIIIFKIIFEFFFQLIMLLLSQKVELSISSLFYRHIQSLPISFFEKKQTGEIISRIDEIREIQQAINRVVLVLINDLLAIFLFTGILIYLNWLLALLSFPFVILLGITIFFIGPLLRKKSLERLEKRADFNAYVCEALGGIRTIKAFVAENRISHLIKRYFIKYNNAFFKEATLEFTSSAIADFLTIFSIVFIFWFGGLLVIKERLTLGSLLTFTLLFERLLSPWRELATLNDDLQRAFSGIKRFYEIFDLKEEIRDNSRAIKLPFVSGNVEFIDVTFSYNGKQEVLCGINLYIPEKTVIALVGRSGAGKSTLCHLIMRFYDPSSGSILIDGYNLKDVNISSLREQIAFVSQETFLFSGTIMENLKFRLKIKDDEIINACKKAGLHKFVEKFPLGYDTVIGERGMTISGGQRQIISIARAILKNAPILILDEPTSSCDLETERIIQEALLDLMKGRTTIIIAHRLFTIKKADMIVVLDKGRIIEMGKHQELMDKKGLYFHLYEQAGIV